MTIRISRVVETTISSIILLIFVFLTTFTAIAQEQTEEKTTLKSEEIESQKSKEIESQKSEEIESQLYELKTTLYCFCGCDRMTFEICHCVTAESVKKEFRKALLENKTVEEIRAAYLKQHGPQFYAVMPAKGINLLAYLMPVVILIVIGGVATIVLKESRKNKTPLTQPDQQISDELQQKVEAELEKFKEQN